MVALSTSDQTLSALRSANSPSPGFISAAPPLPPPLCSTLYNDVIRGEIYYHDNSPSLLRNARSHCENPPSRHSRSLPPPAIPRFIATPHSAPNICPSTLLPFLPLAVLENCLGRPRLRRVTAWRCRHLRTAPSVLSTSSSKMLKLPP